MENNMESPQKIKIKLLYDAAILPLGICPKESKSRSQKRYLHFHVLATLFTINKMWK